LHRRPPEITTLSKRQPHLGLSPNAEPRFADCFKYRNKIGLDVALKALRDCRRKKKATMDELWDAAKTCRVAKVMRPYVEAIA